MSVLEGQCLFYGSFDGLRSRQARLLPELSRKHQTSGITWERIVPVMLLSVWRAWFRFRTLQRVETLHAPNSKQQDQIERLRGRLVAAAAVLRQLLPDTIHQLYNDYPISLVFRCAVEALRSILDSVDGGRTLALASQDAGHLPWAKATAIQDRAHGPIGRGLPDVTTVFLGGALATKDIQGNQPPIVLGLAYWKFKPRLVHYWADAA